MRGVLLSLAVTGTLAASVPAVAQVAATPRDQAYCDSHYYLGASWRLNCILNSRQSGGISGSVFDPPFYYRPRAGY